MHSNKYVNQLWGQSVKTSLVLLVLLCLVSQVFGYYCDHNYCHNSSQYCCGDNLCCDYVNQTLFNSIIIIIAIIIISSIFWALFRIFCFNNAIVIIKKIGQKLIFKQNISPNDQKWFEDTESSLLTDDSHPNNGSKPEIQYKNSF